MKAIIVAASLTISMSMALDQGRGFQIMGGRNPTICQSTFNTAQVAEVSCHASGYHWEPISNQGSTGFRCGCGPF